MLGSDVARTPAEVKAEVENGDVLAVVGVKPPTAGPALPLDPSCLVIRLTGVNASRQNHLCSGVGRVASQRDGPRLLTGSADAFRSHTRVPGVRHERRGVRVSCGSMYAGSSLLIWGTGPPTIWYTTAIGNSFQRCLECMCSHEVSGRRFLRSMWAKHIIYKVEFVSS